MAGSTGSPRSRCPIPERSTLIGDDRLRRLRGERAPASFDELVPDSYRLAGAPPRFARRVRPRCRGAVPELRTAVGAAAGLGPRRPDGRMRGPTTASSPSRAATARAGSSGWPTSCCTIRPGRSRRSRRVRAEGIRLAMIAPAPVDGKPLSHADFDPVWAAFSDDGVAPVFHVSEFESPLASGLAGRRARGRRAALRLHLLVPGARRRPGQPHPQRRPRAVPALAHRCGRADGELGPATSSCTSTARRTSTRSGTASRSASWPPVPRSTSCVRSGSPRCPTRCPNRLVPKVGEDTFMIGSDWPHAEGVADPMMRRRARRGRTGRCRAEPTCSVPTRRGCWACDHRPRSRGRLSESGCARPTCRSRRTDRHRPPVVSTTWRSCAPTSSGRSASTRICSGFPLAELFENRDYKGSTHLFFDLGHDNTLAFFDFPGLGLGPYAEVLGGFHHLAISVDRDQWDAARTRLEEAGVAHADRERDLASTSPIPTACGSSSSPRTSARSTALRCTDGRHRAGQPGRQGA